jgi:hypothetical protein
MLLDPHSIANDNDEACNDDEDDDEVPWDESNGYAGSTWDYDYDFYTALKPLESFDFSAYWELFPAGDNSRTITMMIEGEPHTASFEAYQIHQLVEAIPYITAEYHCPANQGPCGGSGYGLYNSAGVSLEAMQKAARALRFALEADLLKLEAADEAEERERLRTEAEAQLAAERGLPAPCSEA